MSFIKKLMCTMFGCKMEHKGSTIMKNFTIRYYVCKNCDYKTEDVVHHDIV
ncbi:hypothetical protein BPS13_0056 [Bacillus phage BPS13]|uniref:Uncharacterized protein n=2 Tax=Wphvirus BPS13 TaxID=1987727 RepID=A0A173GBS9_9CAUD|nr:hypothetical protein BPS13_0056 [Bacillus phage BPS13]YP_009281972.1 hypothetical protein SALINJAH_18 [Bacillus phage SalinJah]AEZ50235.1 hypothetical protein BPS13_0056 [Bacillus phage BPS13]ANH50665.1 hypothetical protein SALINJAH_18 [Bacillus phage SalinJah]